MEPGIYQTWKLVKYIIGNRTETRQKINAVPCSRGIYLSVYLTLKVLFVCVKDRTYLRMEIPAYCFSISWSIFGILFCLHIKKSILGCDTIWQSIRKFLWAVWYVSTFPHMDEEEPFLSSKLNIGMVWIFYNFSLDLKIWT